MSFPIHIRMHAHLRCLVTSFLQPTKRLPQNIQSTLPLYQHAYSTKGTLPSKTTEATRTIKSSRDSTPSSHTSSSSSTSGRYRRGTLGRVSTVTDLRRAVMDEVAIPGRYQQYFRPDRRTTRKAEGSVLSMDRSRSPKKVSAAKWSQHDSSLDDAVFDGETNHSDNIEGYENKTGGDGEVGASRPLVSTRTRRSGFDNVGWRALEETYARDVLPHPYFHQDYLDITEIKLLPDRKTFQLWYRPKPDDRVSADEIAEVITKHGLAFKAMLSRHAPRASSASSKLVFQLVRQSDRQADMPDLWKRLEEQVDMHSNDDDDADKQEEGTISARGGRRRK